MSNWTRADLPEVPALRQADDEQGDGTRSTALSIALDVVVEHLNRTMIKFPKEDMRRPLVVPPPSFAEIAQEQRDRAERAEGACAQLRELLRELECRKSQSCADAERDRDELEAANEKLHREWTAEFIRANHAEAERDELRAVFTAEKDELVRRATKENQA